MVILTPFLKVLLKELFENINFKEKSNQLWQAPRQECVKICFLLLNQIIFGRYSKERSHWDSSFGHQKYMVKWMTNNFEKNNPVHHPRLVISGILIEAGYQSKRHNLYYTHHLKPWLVYLWYQYQNFCIYNCQSPPYHYGQSLAYCVKSSFPISGILKCLFLYSGFVSLYFHLWTSQYPQGERTLPLHYKLTQFFHPFQQSLFQL